MYGYRAIWVNLVNTCRQKFAVLTLKMANKSAIHIVLYFDCRCTETIPWGAKGFRSPFFPSPLLMHSSSFRISRRKRVSNSLNSSSYWNRLRRHTTRHIIMRDGMAAVVAAETSLADSLWQNNTKDNYVNKMELKCRRSRWVGKLDSLTLKSWLPWSRRRIVVAHYINLIYSISIEDITRSESLDVHTSSSAAAA